MIGKTLQEVSDTTFVKVSFTDYVGRVIVPNTLSVANYILSQNNSVRHQIGRAGAGNYIGSWTLAGNVFEIISTQSSSTNIIDTVNRILLRSITTDDFTYTKFKFV